MIIESESKKSKIKMTYKHVAVKLSFCLIYGLWWGTNAIYLYRWINKGTPRKANHMFSMREVASSYVYSSSWLVLNHEKVHLEKLIINHIVIKANHK
jgi:hypothetical protein